VTLEQERIDMLTQAAEHRAKEVMHHQINIDNYTLAIAEIDANHGGDVEMSEFAGRLSELLHSSKREQAREAVMLKVIKSQLE
jgi:hypothetical protein